MKTILRPPTPVPPPSEEVNVTCTSYDGDGLWAWDGTTRSYEWKLMRLEVRS
jgi:hypothetical protein